MTAGVLRSMRKRAIEERELLPALNQEVVPLLASIREKLNSQLHLPAAGTTSGFGTLVVDFSASRRVTVELGENVAGVTLTAPQDGGEYFLLVKQLGAFTITGWPSNVKWFGGGTAPVITATAERYDLIAFYFDGTSYFGSVLQNAA
jgi:hypothetical protein